MTQQGYKDLGRLEDAREHPLFKCPVCFTECDYERNIDDDDKKQQLSSATSLCVTSCLHLTCLGCAQQQTLTAGVDQVMRQSWRMDRREAMELANQGKVSAPCVICRRPYKLRDCIVVARPNHKKALLLQEERLGLGPTSSEEDKKKHDDDAKMDTSNDAAAAAAASEEEEEKSEDDGKDGPKFRAAASVAEALDLAPIDDVPRPTNRWMTPSIPMRLHTYLNAVRDEAQSTKIAALMKDVSEILSTNPLEKIVVFTSLRPAVDHVASAFTTAGVGHTRLVSGNSTALSVAVQDWKTKDDVNVIIIHAGAAAAGVTLTAARWCFILEPFASAGDEAQAKNRCHRIGQDRDVNTVTYYLQNSIEERLLAYRQREDTTASLSVLATSSGDATRTMSLPKLRFLVGIDDTADTPQFTTPMVDDDDDDHELMDDDSSDDYDSLLYNY